MKKLFALTALSLLSTALSAQPKPSPFVGSYKAGTVDTISQVALLPDQTFCYAFMGGSLDLLIAGHWQTNDANSISLKEHDQHIPDFLLRSSPSEEDAQVKQPQIHFAGRSLARDLSIVFGTSRDQLRPILSSDYNGFESSYKVDVPKGTRSVFLGRVNREKEAAREGYAVYRVAEYGVDFTQSKVTQVWFNTDATRKRLDLIATLKNGRLLLSGDSRGFARDNQLKPEAINQIKKNCVEPILNNTHASKWPQPKNEFELELPVQNLKPYFDKKTDESEPKAE